MRKKRKFLKALLIACSAFLVFPSHGQQNSLIPPLPEAASFFKSTDIPVSMYTGLPNVGVDFYTIKTKELQLPIRISYNARGIQVAEVASRTGIGWALQYGGMISRQIRGSADEESWGILNQNYYNDVFTSSSARGSLMDAIVNNNIDEYPDQFFFDVNGESGKFTIDHNDSSVVLQKFDDIKIIPSFSVTDGKIVSWVVTDRLGNKYYYGRSKNGSREANEADWVSENYSFSDVYGMASLGNSENRINSSWHLMEIETYLHETIEFFYELEEGVRYVRSYDKIEYAQDLDGAPVQPKQVKCFFSNVYSHQYQISEIRFPQGKIIFEADSNERKDFTNTHALRSISVKDERDRLLKRFDLSYFYKRCIDDDNQLPYLKLIDTTAKYRLFLSSVKEKSISDSLPPYLFEYDSVLLPNRFSNALDNWGYYNGKFNGSFLTFHSYHRHINRTVDTALSGAGLLNKITYPTGGSSKFKFEQNRVKAPAFINELLYNQINPVDTIYIGEAFFRDTAYLSDSIYSKEFVIGTNILQLSDVSFSFVQPVGINTSNSNYQVILQRLDSAGTYYLYPPDTALQLDLDPGHYKLKVVPTDIEDTIGFIASIIWPAVIQNPTLDSGELYGAGKRIKKIEHRIGNDLVSLKEYEYKGSDGKTSGKMLGLPNFHYIQKHVAIINGGGPLIDQYGSIPGSPLTQLQGNSVGYSWVTEYYGDSAVNAGKAVYEFTNDEDAGDYYEFPYHLPIDFEWLRGKPLNTKIYKKTIGSYELQKSIQNTYLHAGTLNLPNVFTTPFVHMDSVYVYRKTRNLYYLPLLIFTPSPGGPFNIQTYKIYYQSAGTVDLASTIEKQYAGGFEVTSETNFGYNYQKHYGQVVQKNLTSRGDSSIVTSVYPLDIVSKTAAEQKLVDLHRLAVPVRVEAQIKNSSNTVLGSTKKNTVYKDWGNNLVLAEHVQSSVNNASYVTGLTYNKYDSSGSPLEIKPRSGVHEVYVWGYNRQYPVAKVIGSGYSTVVGFVDTVMLKNAGQYSDVQIRTELNKIRTGLAATGAQVFTYTYKPLVGITSSTDPGNRTVFYEYDAYQRLHVIRDKDSNITKRICYNYQGQEETCLLYTNVQKSGSFTRNNCPTGGTGGSVSYIVAAGAYVSTISQAHSDAQAQAEVDQRGQAYANTHGTCTFYNVVKTGNFTRNNCGSGYTGSTVTYTVSANTYSSNVSQAAADALAQADVNNNGQAYANANGTCTSTCNTSNCTGLNRKCINGACELGIKVYTDCYYDAEIGKYIKFYHYEWSDESWSDEYSEETTHGC